MSLPEELIAQRPPEVRGASRMLVLGRESGEFKPIVMFGDLPSLLAGRGFAGAE